MALKGTLKDFSLADIFQLIGIQKKTGVLTLKNAGEVVTVTFVSGDVVMADALRKRIEDRLGTVLVKSGRLTEAQLQEALKIQKSTLKRLGNILVENRFLDANGLRDALQVQVSQMVYRLFRWRDGEYDFTQDERPDYDKDFVVPMSAEAILMEGARILDEWPMIEKSIRSMQTVWKHANVEIAARPTEEGEAAAGVTLSEEERSLFGLVDGKRTVQEIIERSARSEFETCRILHDLIARQLLEEARGAASRAPAGAVAPTPGRTAAAPIMPPLVLGLAYVVLVVLLGAVVYQRAQAFMASRERGETVGSLLSILLDDASVRDLGAAIARSRLQRVDHAIRVYYLLYHGYPENLRHLVTAKLLQPAGILDPWGREIGYDIGASGYRLRLAAESQAMIASMVTR